MQTWFTPPSLPPISLSLLYKPVFPSSSHQVDGVTHRVQQYQFIGWATQFFPSVPTFVDFLCDVLKEADSLQKKQRLLIHDTWVNSCVYHTRKTVITISLSPSQQKPWSLRYLLLPVLLCGTTKAWENGGCVSGSAEDAATETRDGGVSAAVWLHLWLYVWVH